MSGTTPHPSLNQSVSYDSLAGEVVEERFTPRVVDIDVGNLPVDTPPVVNVAEPTENNVSSPSAKLITPFRSRINSTTFDQIVSSDSSAFNISHHNGEYAHKMEPYRGFTPSEANIVVPDFINEANFMPESKTTNDHGWQSND